MIIFFILNIKYNGLDRRENEKVVLGININVNRY